MTAASSATIAAAPAFDGVADDYDASFTFSNIGRAQRDVVWQRILSVFHAGDHILELNCGTGQDALFMVQAGMRVTGCDASPRMVECARRSVAAKGVAREAEFHTLATEELRILPEQGLFDGLLSNFGGLNCVSDLSLVACEAARRLKPGAPLLLCLLNRVCAWEIAYYLLRGRVRKAVRRCGGAVIAQMGEHTFPVQYPTVAELRGIFEPEFRIVALTGVGITVPPSYCESWIARWPRLLRGMKAIDDQIRATPGIRTLGDHILLHVEKRA